MTTPDRPLDLYAIRARTEQFVAYLDRWDGNDYTLEPSDVDGTVMDVEALLAEVERLNKRLNDAHEALTRVEDDDPDEFVSLESTVEWVVTRYRALRKDFDELHDMLGTDGGS